MRELAAGIDVGGTTVKTGLFNLQGELQEKWEIPTDTSGSGSRILPQIAESLRQHAGGMEKKYGESTRITAAGIDVPGAVLPDGTVNRCVNLGWGRMPIREECEKLFGVPVRAANDANAAALGELWRGGGKGFRNAAVITLGTGVGGGIVLDGSIVPGYFGAAGEIGHMQVNPNETEYCGCGKRGCLEQYCAAPGMVRTARKYLDAHPEQDSILRGRPGGMFSAKDLFDAAREGDAAASAIAEFILRTLARGLSFISCVVDPEVFVIGGGVSAAGDILIRPLQKYYREAAFHASRDTEFRLAELGNDAGIYGAVKLVLDL